MIQVDANNQVEGRELHKEVEVKTRYREWVRRCIDYADLIEGKDYCYELCAGNRGGSPAVNHTFTLDAAKEICIVSATPKAKELRRWLINLSNKVENGELFSPEQIIYMTKLKEVFKYIDLCREQEKNHLETFKTNNPKSYNIYAEFHTMRNNALNIHPNTIDQRIKEWCIENNKATTKSNMSKTDKLLLLDKYEVLRNGVWDFLKAKESKWADNVANLVKAMAKTESIEMYRNNNDSLFRSQQVLPNVSTNILS
jgi:phage anti-repressor protein